MPKNAQQSGHGGQDDCLQSLFQQSPQPMWIYDTRTFAFLDVNDAAVRHYGYSRDEFLGMTIKDIRPAGDVEALERTVRQPDAGPRRSGRWRHRKKDGAIIEVEILSHGVVCHGRDSRIVFVFDVTDHVRALNALRESEEKYRDLFENANDAIFIVSSDLYYRDANKKALELLGFTKEELLRHRVLDLVPPEQHPRSEAEFTKLREHGSYDVFVGKMRTKDGRWIDIEVSSSAIYEGDTITGSRDIVRDITGRKRMEEDQFRAQKLESLGVLAGGLAHDFNNLLTAITGNISLSLLDVEPSGPVFLQLQKAEKAALRARDLTQQLLTFSKGGEPVKQTIVPEDIIRDSVGFALRGSRTRAEVAICGGLQPVDADEGQLSQVISNLVINADQAMPGGGTLRISCENAALAEGALPPLPAGDYVKISVEDSGIGIPPEHLRKIFDPYFTTKQKGSGLGLATSYSIIKRHRGHITVESVLGEGSIFHVYLPASGRAIGRKVFAEGAVAFGTGRILVMDDEEMIRDVAGTMLRKAGYEVALARDGAEAVAAYREAGQSGRPFDAVIMDITVPGGMGGEETIRKLRDLDPGVKAIVSSGYSNDPVMAQYREYGFLGVVSKPYTVEGLSTAVRQVLAGKQ